MSIPPALSQIEQLPWQVAIALAIAAIPIGIAGLAGVFHRESVLGPTRVGEDEQPSSIWLILMIGFLAWLSVPILYGSIRPRPSDSGKPPTSAMTRLAATRSADSSHPAASTTQTITVRPGAATVPTSTTSAPPEVATPIAGSQSSLSEREMIVLNTVSGVVVLAALLLSNVFLRRHGLQRLGLTGATLKRVFIPAAVSILIFLPLTFLATALTQSLWQLINYTHPDAHPLLEVFKDQTNPGLRALVILTAVVLAPIGEELLFRGHLQTAILHTISPRADSPAVRWIAIILTSLAFTLFHQGLWMMPPIFFLSICLGYAYERTGNLWVSIFIHASFNSINVLFFWMRIAGITH